MSKLAFVLIFSIFLIEFCSAGKRILTKIIARTETTSELGKFLNVCVFSPFACSLV